MKTRLVLAACVYFVLAVSAHHSFAAEAVAAYRALPQPRVMYVADNPVQDRFAELLRCNVPAQVTLIPVNYGDHEMFHLCDKPLEARAEEIAQVDARGRQFLDDQLRHERRARRLLCHAGGSVGAKSELPLSMQDPSL